MCQTRAVNFQNPKAGEVTTVADFLRNSAVRDPDRIALVEAQSGVRVSYASLDAQVSSTAAALLASGLIP